MGSHVGIVGGTGPAGSSLAARLASVGVLTTVGSREVERSSLTVDTLVQAHPSIAPNLVPGSNEDAAKCDIVVVATPWEMMPRAVEGLRELLDDKTVICMANALLRVASEFQAIIPVRGSAAQTLQSILPRSHVVAAMQHIPAKELGNIDHPLALDVLVCGDVQSARNEVVALLSRIQGCRALDAGSLASAGPIEAMTAVLLNLNLKYRTRTAIKVTGIES